MVPNLVYSVGTNRCLDATPPQAAEVQSDVGPHSVYALLGPNVSNLWPYYESKHAWLGALSLRVTRPSQADKLGYINPPFIPQVSQIHEIYGVDYAFVRYKNTVVSTNILCHFYKFDIFTLSTKPSSPSTFGGGY
jgi:hypothetical protein